MLVIASDKAGIAKYVSAQISLVGLKLHRLVEETSQSEAPIRVAKKKKPSMM